MNAEEHIERYNRVVAELSDPTLTGPDIVRRSDTFAVRDDLLDTGYRFELRSQHLGMSARILRKKVWRASPLWDLFLDTDEVTYSFFAYPYDVPSLNGTPLIRLSSALAEVYTHSQSAHDVLRPIEQCAPLVTRDQGYSALPSATRDCLLPTLTSLGFTIMKVSPQRDCLRVRFAWLLPSDRDRNTPTMYLPAGTMRLRSQGKDLFATSEWLPKSMDRISGLLQDRLASAIQEQPSGAFSERGRARISDIHSWESGTPSPRKLAHLKRIEFISQHHELWAHPKKLTEALFVARLYSNSTSRYQVESSLGNLIEEARQNADCNHQPTDDPPTTNST